MHFFRSAAAVLFALQAGICCGAEPLCAGTKTPVPGAYNVVIIMLDSVRADHLSCYGYERHTTPAIDRFAGEGILFEQAIAQSTWSLPSHCSVVTSRYVPSHGVYGVERRLSDSEITLAQVLSYYGYATAAFTGGFWISSVFNVGKGFGLYEDGLVFAKFKDTAGRAVQWLAEHAGPEHAGQRFFLFVQGFDGHSPYELEPRYRTMYADPSYDGFLKGRTLDHRIGDRLTGDRFFPESAHAQGIPVTRRDIDYIISQYDGALNCADHHIGRFLEALDRLGLRDNTIVILTSYHGTPLYEQGVILRRLHGGSIEGTIRVPLIIRLPSGLCHGRKVLSQVELVDVMPTIFDLLGIPLNHQAQGKSLVPLIQGRSDRGLHRYAYVSGFREHAVRTEGWKLVMPHGHGSRPALYDLRNDPREQRDRAGQEPGIAAELAKQLGAWLEDCISHRPGTGTGLDKREKFAIEEKMKAAGYWFVDVPEEDMAFGRELPKTRKE